jgi:CubicO group peptidase (beta-lactamase class C family)
MLQALPLLLLLSHAPADAAQQVDAVFAPWSSLESPGCAVGVAQDGLVVLSRAYGMADLEHDVPNTPATIFEAGSISKQFTAAAVLLLELDGTLSLDDDVRKYVPEVPDLGRTITLRHLLTHTSGLRDWGSVAELSGWGREKRTHTHAHVLDIVSRQSALNFDPGEEFSYCNTGYNLAAVVVSRVSGVSFAELCRRRIFEPLGLGHTEWRDDYQRIVKNRSTAYSVSGHEVRILRPIENVHGNGGLLTTVGDLLVWNQALSEERFGAAFSRLQLERGHLNDGSAIGYAAGLFIGSFAGVPSITHGGATAGYRAFLARYPEQGLSIAMLCNASNVSAGEIAGRIARIYLGDAAKPPSEPAPYAVPIEELQVRAGLYREVRRGAPARLELVEGKLQVVGWTTLVPTSPVEFQAGADGPRVVFDDASRGARAGFRIVRDDSRDERFEPVDAFAPGPPELRAFEGEYYSADAEATLTVTVDAGGLVVHRRPDWTTTLTPQYRDAFDSPDLGLIRFRRASAGRVTELSVSQSRVYDMRFRRVGDVKKSVRTEDAPVR